MKITKTVIQKLDTLITLSPPETGGILGSYNKDIISDIILDKPEEKQARLCSYSPNVAFLNRCIANWKSSGKEFMGLFHTHFASVKTLSPADRKYIAEIMSAMPETIDSLFFPIYVLPERELVCYRAGRKGCHIEIEKEETLIVQDDIIIKGGKRSV